MDRVDVAVVGGGPAGASAAQAAAANDAETIVFEKGVPRADREGLGPDSTDAAGILDYWVDLMELDPTDLPDGIILRTLDHAEFIGPTESVTIRNTGIPSPYPHFGFTYDRAAFDTWLKEQAESAGADYSVGTAVVDVTTRAEDSVHTLSLQNGDQLEATHLILADGPQRTVTMGVLDQFLPTGRAETVLGASHANHIAYQEYRRFPKEIFEPSAIKFWWGHMPGHTAYPWIFPNDGTIARVGLTMPIGLDLQKIPHRDTYKLLRSDDERIPQGNEYIGRLLEYAYPEYELDDFPLVTSRGKQDGTETYPISSTLPIDSPVQANIAVTGGAMGATSAFHEGGGHLAIRTGKIAGTLAATGELHRYNHEWKQALGDEIRRNAAMADLVRGYTPQDWDRAFRVANQFKQAGLDSGIGILRGTSAAGWAGLRLAFGYQRRKYRYRKDRFIQIAADEYLT